MAKSAKSNLKSTPAPAAASAAKKVASKAPVKTEVRNSPIPKTAAAKPAAARAIVGATVTHEAIALRAYEISVSGTGGSQVENWLRAERELRGSV